MTDNTETKYQTKFTKAELDAWTTRLRDPNSKQSVGNAVRIEGQHVFTPTRYETKGDELMCCLVHGQHVLEGRAVINAYDDDYWKFFESRNVPACPLVGMNDDGKHTLLQIADWIDAHLLPTDIL
jgi:hypothetical protein